MVKPKRRVVYVEGGGDKNPKLASECRRAFSTLFENAGVQSKPQVIACGGRKNAYDQFCQALEDDREDPLLLVDAEERVVSSPQFDPWSHVRARVGDGWRRPHGARDDQLHLMNVVMETWLLADRQALRDIFGPKFDMAKLPDEGATLESASKQAIYKALAAAAKPTPAGEYGKGAHSFNALARVSPAKLRALPWANRFLTEMGAKY